MLTYTQTAEMATMYPSAVFWAALKAGLASPVALYSAPTSYVLNLGVYNVGASFAQVGMTLTQASASILNGELTDEFIEYDPTGQLPGEYGGLSNAGA